MNESKVRINAVVRGPHVTFVRQTVLHSDQQVRDSNNRGNALIMRYKDVWLILLDEASMIE